MVFEEKEQEFTYHYYYVAHTFRYVLDLQAIE
jgi:hypothetical protein